MEEKQKRKKYACCQAANDTTLRVNIPAEMNDALIEVGTSMGVSVAHAVRFAIYDYLARYTDIKLPSAPSIIITPSRSN